MVLSVVFIHLYHGAPEANAATQTSASITSAVILDFTQYPFEAMNLGAGTSRFLCSDWLSDLDLEPEFYPLAECGFC
jgi:hypothetical protein